MDVILYKDMKSHEIGMRMSVIIPVLISPSILV